MSQDEIGEKVANRIFASGMLREREGGDGAIWEAALKLADAILAIPEIAEALEISAAHPDNDFRDYLLRRGRWKGVSKSAGYV